MDEKQLTSQELNAAFAAADQLARAHSKTFFLATSLLPAAARRAIRALYAFCRSTDDLVDVAGATVAGLEGWRAAAAQPARHQADPLLLAWAHVRERYGVDTRYQNELIDGVTLDLRQTRYSSWPMLERYCYLVASTVGLMSIPIIGLARGARFSEAAPYAIRLGIALQFTNILRDVGEDAARGRLYLPLSDLERFGLSEAEVLAGVHDERFSRLMAFEIERTRRLYAEALPGIALLAPAARPAVAAAALLYRAILERIEAIECRVHSQRASTTAAQKLWMLPMILWTVMTLRPPRQTAHGERRPA